MNAGRRAPEPGPDMAEFQAHRPDEFRFWLRGPDLATLRSVVRANGFDPGKRSTRWKKLSNDLVRHGSRDSARGLFKSLYSRRSADGLLMWVMEPMIS